MDRSNRQLSNFWLDICIYTIRAGLKFIVVHAVVISGALLVGGFPAGKVVDFSVQTKQTKTSASNPQTSKPPTTKPAATKPNQNIEKLEQELIQILTQASLQQVQLVNATQKQIDAFNKAVSDRLLDLSDRASKEEATAKNINDKAAYALIRLECRYNTTQNPELITQSTINFLNAYREANRVCKPIEELFFQRYLPEASIIEIKKSILQSKNPEVLCSWALSEQILNFITDKADINDLKFLGMRFPDTAAGKRATQMFNFRSKFSLDRPIPDFEIEMMNGQKGRISQLKGKAVMIHFWGFWNPASMDEIGQLRALEKEYRSSLVILGINTDNWTKAFLEQRMKEAGIAWSNHMAGKPSGRLPIDFGIKTYPSKIIIDKEGIVRYVPGQESWRDVLLRVI